MHPSPVPEQPGQVIFTWRLENSELIPVVLEPPPATLDGATRLLPAGAYTTFATLDQGRRVLGLSEHLLRLERSAQQVGWLGRLDQGALRIALRQAAAHLAPQNSRLRITLDLTRQPGTIYISQECMQPLPQQVYTLGVSVLTCTAQRNAPEAKLTGFVTATQDLRAARPARIFELLLLDEHRRILEGMTSNFYAIIAGEIWTAGEGMLQGVTRASVLRLARQLEIPVIYQPPALADLQAFEEAFITSSSRGVVPVVHIDEVTIGSGAPGPLTQRLLEMYDATVFENAETI